MYNKYTLKSPDLDQFDQMSPCLQYLGGKLELIPPSVPSEDGQQLAVFLEVFFFSSAPPPITSDLTWC